MTARVKTVRVRVAKKSERSWHDRYYCRSASHPRLKVKYNEQIIPELEEGVQVLQPDAGCPCQKVVVSMGVGAALPAT